MKGRPPCRLRRSCFPLAVAVVLAVAGCAPPTAGPDPGRPQTLKVEMATFAVAVTAPGLGGALDPVAEERLRQFVRLYINRARSPLHVATAPGGDPTAAQAQADDVRNRLLVHGVRPADIVVDAGLSPAGGARTVVLSFRGYRVLLPECGDWSGSSGFNPTNLPHTNFGCSFQRNFGLMVSDPGDLLKSGPLGPPDPVRMNIVIEGYRAGAAEGEGSE